MWQHFFHSHVLLTRPRHGIGGPSEIAKRKITCIFKGYEAMCYDGVVQPFSTRVPPHASTLTPVVRRVYSRRQQDNTFLQGA